jgi:hypothetical protein
VIVERVMTDTTPGPARTRGLDFPVMAYLEELDSAAHLAGAIYDQADAAVRIARHYWCANMNFDARTRPGEFMRTAHHGAAVAARDAAESNHRMIVDWFARAATLALQSLIDGGNVTTAELETHAFPQPARVERPPLPPVGTLTIGSPDVDARTFDATRKLLAFYQLEEKPHPGGTVLLHRWATAISLAAQHGIPAAPVS